jgi:hypothetical protein
MLDALEHHHVTVNIGGRTIANLCFADDIDGLAGTEEEHLELIENLDKALAAYRMEISAEKTKLMNKNPTCIQLDIKVGEKLETVKIFKYLKSVLQMKGPNQRYCLELPRQQQQ